MVDALSRAIKAEVEGQHFYSMAARNTRDHKARKVLRTLAREEKEHELFLWSQYQSILESEGPDKTRSLGSRAHLSSRSPIFSPALRAAVTSAHFEVSVLAIAVRLELRAMKFYARAARSAADPTLSRFFAELAEWEKGHHDALARQLDALKGEYWSTNGFTPI